MKKKRLDLFFCITIILSSSLLYTVKTKQHNKLCRNIVQNIDNYSLQDIKKLSQRLSDINKDIQVIVQKIIYKKNKNKKNVASKILHTVPVEKKKISKKLFSNFSKKEHLCELSEVFGLISEFFYVVPTKGSYTKYSLDRTRRYGTRRCRIIAADTINPKRRKIMEMAINRDCYGDWEAQFYKDEPIAQVKADTKLRMFDTINSYCMYTFKPGCSTYYSLLSSDMNKLLIDNCSENKFYFFDLNPLQKLRADFKSLSLLQVFVLRKLFKQLGTLKTDEESRSNQILKKIKSKLVTTRLNNEEEKILSSLPQSIKVAVKKMR